ncbi:hypothetical protein Tco_0947338, partial [Tanacetum coccineum]
MWELDRMISESKILIFVREPSRLLFPKGLSRRRHRCDTMRSYEMETRSKELLAPVTGGNVISPSPLIVFATFFVANISLGLLDNLESSLWLVPRYEENLSLSLFPLLLSHEESLLNLSKFSQWSFGVLFVETSFASIQDNETSSAFSFLLLDVMYCEMCLRKLNLLAKMGSKLFLQIFVVKNATCLLTIPLYSGGIFKRIGEHKIGHGHCPFLHTDGTFEEVQEIVGSPPKEGLALVTRQMVHGCPYERLSVTQEMRTVRRENPSYVSRRMTASVYGGQGRLQRGLPPFSFLSTLLPYLFGASLNSTTLSFCLRTLEDAACRIGVASQTRVGLGSISLSSSYSSLKYSSLIRRSSGGKSGGIEGFLRCMLDAESQITCDNTNENNPLCECVGVPANHHRKEPNAMDVGLRFVASSHTGTHREDDFTPLETIPRFL